MPSNTENLNFHKQLLDLCYPLDPDDEHTKTSFRYLSELKYPFPLELKHHDVYALRMWFTETRIIYVAVTHDSLPIHLFSLEIFEFLLQMDGFTITTPEEALGYTTTAFTLTPPLSGLFYLISKARDLPVWKEEKRTETVERFESIIVPPSVISTDQGFTVTFYACHNDTLRYYTVQVSASGHFEYASTLLADNLPLMIHWSLVQST